MYGFQDSSEVAAGSAGGRLGLNKGFITKFEFNPNSGQDGAEQDGIFFTITVEDKEFRKRFFPISKVFKKGGGEISDVNSDEYKEEKAKAVKLLNAELSSIVEVFTSTDNLKEALSIPIATFKDFAQVLERLIKGNPNWDKTPVDVFLQYQWQPSGENTKTFLQLPSNVKQGIYVIKSVPGEFKEDKTDSHLQYVNAEGGIHPFKRGKWWVESAFAKQADLAPAAPTMGQPGAASTGGW